MPKNKKKVVKIKKGRAPRAPRAPRVQQKENVINIYQTPNFGGNPFINSTLPTTVNRNVYDGVNQYIRQPNIIDTNINELVKDTIESIIKDKEPFSKTQTSSLGIQVKPETKEFETQTEKELKVQTVSRGSINSKDYHPRNSTIENEMKKSGISREQAELRLIDRYNRAKASKEKEAKKMFGEEKEIMEITKNVLDQERKEEDERQKEIMKITKNVLEPSRTFEKVAEEKFINPEPKRKFEVVKVSKGTIEPIKNLEVVKVSKGTIEPIKNLEVQKVSKGTIEPIKEEPFQESQLMTKPKNFINPENRNFRMTLGGVPLNKLPKNKIDHPNYMPSIRMIEKEMEKKGISEEQAKKNLTNKHADLYIKYSLKDYQENPETWRAPEKSDKPLRFTEEEMKESGFV